MRWSPPDPIPGAQLGVDDREAIAYLYGPPRAPRFLNAELGANNRVELVWEDASETETGFAIYRRDGGNVQQIGYAGAGATRRSLRRLPARRSTISSEARKMSSPKTLVLQISPALEKRLTVVAKARSETWEALAEEALSGFLDLFDWQAQAIRQGVREAQAGELIDHQKVAAWLESWGSDRELPKPKCD